MPVNKTTYHLPPTGNEDTKGRVSQGFQKGDNKRKQSYNTRNSDCVTSLRKILWLMYNVKWALMKDGGFDHWRTWKFRVPQTYSSVMVIKILSDHIFYEKLTIPNSAAGCPLFYSIIFFCLESALNVNPSSRCFRCTGSWRGTRENMQRRFV